MSDTNNPFDQEHLVEVVGIVESVTTDCTGDGVDFTDDDTETNAVIVLSGQISFDSLPNESSLSPGVVYYLWDKGNPQNLALGNNVVNDTNEPVISKPLFLSTGTHSAVVLTYRPLTGSPNRKTIGLKHMILKLKIFQVDGELELKILLLYHQNIHL